MRFVIMVRIGECFFEERRVGFYELIIFVRLVLYLFRSPHIVFSRNMADCQDKHESNRSGRWCVFVVAGGRCVFDLFRYQYRQIPLGREIENVQIELTFLASIILFSSADERIASPYIYLCIGDPLDSLRSYLSVSWAPLDPNRSYLSAYCEAVRFSSALSSCVLGIHQIHIGVTCLRIGIPLGSLRRYLSASWEAIRFPSKLLICVLGRHQIPIVVIYLRIGKPLDSPRRYLSVYCEGVRPPSELSIFVLGSRQIPIGVIRLCSGDPLDPHRGYLSAYWEAVRFLSELSIFVFRNPLGSHRGYLSVLLGSRQILFEVLYICVFGNPLGSLRGIYLCPGKPLDSPRVIYMCNGEPFDSPRVIYLCFAKLFGSIRGVYRCRGETADSHRVTLWRLGIHFPLSEVISAQRFAI